MNPRTPDTVVELVARQLDRANDAKARIEREGTVVRDMKGSVIAHPAIAIEQAALKLIADTILKYRQGTSGRKMPRR